jgi:hypothetical protein
LCDTGGVLLALEIGLEKELVTVTYFFAYAVDNTPSCVQYFVSHSISPCAEIFERRGLT